MYRYFRDRMRVKIKNPLLYSYDETICHCSHLVKPGPESAIGDLERGVSGRC